MGLILDIYRSAQYDSKMNVFYGKHEVTVVNVEGPFEPTEDRPAAFLTENALGSPIVVPLDWHESSSNGKGLIMFGGAFAATSDSRLREALGEKHFYGAIPIHDRVETWEEYERYSA